VDILVIGPEYLQRQDEHPCMKTVWEMDARGGGGFGGYVEEVGVILDQRPYETNEEEFLRTGENDASRVGLTHFSTPEHTQGPV
jgi:hypothetical protein